MTHAAEQESGIAVMACAQAPRTSHDRDARSGARPLTVRGSVLPLSLPPRGLSRLQAAEYVGVGCTKFDEMVGDGRMPKPKRIDSRCVWDRVQLDQAFAALDGGETEPGNPLDGLI